MSDRIMGRTTLTLGDLYRSAYFASSLFVRTIYVGILVLSLVWLAVINIWVERDSITTTHLTPVIVPVIVLIVWLAMIAGVFRRLSVQQLNISYDIDHERISVQDAAGTLIVRPWSQIRACREHSAGFTLRLPPLGAYWLVKRAFGTAELDALRALAQSVVGKT